MTDQPTGPGRHQATTADAIATGQYADAIATATSLAKTGARLKRELDEARAENVSLRAKYEASVENARTAFADRDSWQAWSITRAHERNAARRALAEAEAGWRSVTSALGYGNGITEPMISHADFITEMQERGREASEWRETQLWRGECWAAGHPDDEDCSEHDPALIAEANRATIARVVDLLDRTDGHGHHHVPVAAVQAVIDGSGS